MGAQDFPVRSDGAYFDLPTYYLRAGSEDSNVEDNGQLERNILQVSSQVN